MSNRIVPAIYKQVIEDVISAVREDFEEYGVDDNLVGYLQQLWEASLVQTRVAKFVEGDDEESEEEQPLRNGATLPPPPQQLLNMPRPGNVYTSEDVKPQIDANGNGTYNGGLRGGADGSVRRLRGGARSDDDDDDEDDEDEDVKPALSVRPNAPRVTAPGMTIPGMTGIGIPGIGGEDDYAAIAAQYGNEDDDDDEDDDEPTTSRQPGGMVPGAVASGSGVQRDASGNIISGGAARLVPNEHGIYPGEEIIDSDLDDSDDDEEDERGNGQDDDDDDEEEDLSLNVMYCIYDKVQRNKNKWKVTFRDGMIRANGREYLFNKCTGEFEW